MSRRDTARSDVSLLDLDERPWAAYGSCRGADPDLFFPGEALDPDEGLKICSGCPVRDECLWWALENRIHFGIWGGTTERERRRLMRRSA
ncbi:MAG: WhiB family transcriptional regulator [Actinobacteria bacterium]|nr:WhiB family transcriptional regulator [Actinomycetota bacterium]MBU1493026.1 WhiB family transcriptional regulator [Actinomycetota bacterium]